MLCPEYFFVFFFFRLEFGFPVAVHFLPTKILGSKINGNQVLLLVFQLLLKKRKEKKEKDKFPEGLYLELAKTRGTLFIFIFCTEI